MAQFSGSVCVLQIGFPFLLSGFLAWQRQAGLDLLDEWRREYLNSQQQSLQLMNYLY